jgi:hypothetical protein
VKIVNILLITIIAILSIVAGAAKVMQTPQEMEFLKALGLSTSLILVFGLIQIAGGVLLVPRKTRMFGAVLATAALVVSTVLIFVGGNFAFGLFSILPVALASVVIYQSAGNTQNKSLNTDTGDSGAA